MSDYSPGAFLFADRLADQTVRAAHREAESYRLLCKAKAECGRSRRFYFGVMAWLGHRLTAWGQYLQERYSAEDSAPMPQSA
jgi:hypothetical protein